jgi:tetratricopeptide (TPR) repeat protein
MAEIIDRFYLKEKGFETTQHFITVPYNVLVKFAQWEKIMALPKPDDSLLYPIAIWHYARGMAYASTNKINDAQKELDSLVKYGSMEEIKSMRIFEINSMSDIAAIAILVLKADIAFRNDDASTALKLLQEAIVIEDGLNYNEPPDWFFSVRHILGDMYLHKGEFLLAEKIFREDLDQFPRNGFALNGLYHSLLKQGREEEAEKTRIAFNTAWKRADSVLKYSRIDPDKRTNLAIRVTEQTPDDLIFIAGSFCSM